MIKIRTSLFLFLLFTCYAQVHAQEERKFVHYLNIGAGFTAPTSYDESFSTIIYRGYAGSVAAQYHRRSEDVMDHLDFRFDGGELTNSTSLAYLTYYRFEGNYSYEKKLKNIWQDRLAWYVGGSFNALWTLFKYRDFKNNSFNNSVYASLSPRTSLAYDFNLWNRDFRLTGSAYLPILSIAMRPSYGSSNFFGFLDDDRDDTFKQLVESSKLVSLNKFFRYSNTFALEYFFERNPNRIRLSYEWNYLRYSEPRITQSASHNITFSTMFNF
ncbi:hypothetical protein OKW21_005809 [Catalinimonas alkaloidigena]|uniref:hypothetical protein n=1 Tax=Catalinimonas alkaloidigena TaxID=1075417 RepID=UPI002404F671|nr:hypothetical protein [Catalinimonas alkaloidigena]MDF9800546.1 hypothetical protein [Catalinimonas alkaloidigena]